MAALKFFIPYRAPHPEGEILAKSFLGATPAWHGDELGHNNMHYGILYAQDLRMRCKAQGKRWIHVDHGMFHRSSGLNKWDGYYRFSAECQSNTYRTPSENDRKRLDELLSAGILRVSGYKPPKSGQILAYQPPSDHMRRFANLPPNFDLVVKRVATDIWPNLEFRVYEKGPKQEDFYANLGAFASFGSTISVECLQRGIPFLIAGNRNYMPGCNQVWAGEDKERMLALAYIAGRNFTVREMQNGTALEHMTANGEIALEGK